MALGEGASLVGMSVLPAELAASEEVRLPPYRCI